MSLCPLADRVLAYLRQSIAERGGEGRRPSKIEWEMPGPAAELEDIVTAVGELVVAGLVRWENNEIMGEYVILLEAER